MASQNIFYMPSLLPDELLYSWLARLVAYNQLGNPRKYLELLFGTKDVIPGVDLPTLLEPLQLRLGLFSPCMSADELIDAGTLYPYHRPFLTIARHEAVRHILLFGGGKGLKTLLGRVANRFGANPPLQYCVACFAENVACHGAPYWHRSHQLPGVKCCATHGIDLVTHIFPGRLTDRQRFILPPGKPNGATFRPTSNIHQLQFSILSRDLLHADLPALEAHQRLAIYEAAIKELGFRTRTDRIDHVALKDAVRCHYADFRCFSHRDRLLSTPAHPLRWLRALFQRPLASAHPVCHVLLIGFLFDTIDGFRQAISKVSEVPVANGDLPDQGSQPSFAKAVRERHDPLIRDVSQSCRAVAQALNLSVTTIVQRRRALGLPIAERPKYLDDTRLMAIHQALAKGLSPLLIAQNQRVSTSTVYRLRAQSFEICQPHSEHQDALERKKRREHWEQTIRMVANAGSSQVRAQAPATYAWLYRHDRSWLAQSCKPRRTPVHRSTRVDWAERDLALCQQLDKRITSLKARSKRPRISKTLMRRHLGEAMVRRNVERLPRLRDLMDRLVESPQDFHIFRINVAIARLKTQGLPMALWRIQRLAGIRKFTKTLRAYADAEVAQAA